MGQLPPKAFVFALTTFSKEFDEVYELGIKLSCKEAGTYCERVDEQIFLESILDRIYNQIANADIIVADMTGRNPNVLYEAGYAHALNKPVILLTQKADDIPFDLKHYPHIVYEGKVSTLRTELTKRILWCLENSNSNPNGKELRTGRNNSRLPVSEIRHRVLSLYLTLVASLFFSAMYIKNVAESGLYNLLFPALIMGVGLCIHWIENWKRAIGFLSIGVFISIFVGFLVGQAWVEDRALNNDRFWGAVSLSIFGVLLTLFLMLLLGFLKWIWRKLSRI